MQTFAKLALATGACALGIGAVAPAQAADMGYPEAQAGYPAPPPVEYDTFVAPPYVVAPGPYYGPYWRGYGPRYAYGYGHWRGYRRW